MQPSEIESILERTRVALRTGDLAALPALTSETEAALAHLPQDKATLAALSASAARNAACLSAAMSGLRAARARLAEIGNLARSMGYDGNGRRRELPVSSGVVRRL